MKWLIYLFGLITMAVAIKLTEHNWVVFNQQWLWPVSYLLTGVFITSRLISNQREALTEQHQTELTAVNKERQLAKQLAEQDQITIKQLRKMLESADERADDRAKQRFKEQQNAIDTQQAYLIEREAKIEYDLSLNKKRQQKLQAEINQLQDQLERKTNNKQQVHAELKQEQQRYQHASQANVRKGRTIKALKQENHEYQETNQRLVKQLDLAKNQLSTLYEYCPEAFDALTDHEIPGVS